MKIHRVMSHIHSHYESHRLVGNTDVLWRIAAECDCSLNTVYRAVKNFKALGALTEQGRYRGVKFVTPDMLLAALPSHEFLYHKVETELRAKLFCDHVALYQSFEWAIRSGAIRTFASGNTYGWRLIANKNYRGAAA